MVATLSLPVATFIRPMGGIATISPCGARHSCYHTAKRPKWVDLRTVPECRLSGAVPSAPPEDSVRHSYIAVATLCPRCRQAALRAESHAIFSVVPSQCQKKRCLQKHKSSRGLHHCLGIEAAPPGSLYEARVQPKTYRYHSG